jgi:hypothetical protein
MAIRMEPMGILVTGEVGTGATADSIRVPWANDLLLIVTCAVGAAVVYADRSLDGVAWSTLTGSLVAPNSSTLRLVVPAPIGLVRCYILVNTGTIGITWAAHARKRSG